MSETSKTMLATRSTAFRCEGLLQVGEAAEFLGVCRETLRNWDRSGRLVAQRNPVTGYRYYQQRELEKFLSKIMKERSNVE